MHRIARWVARCAVAVATVVAVGVVGAGSASAATASTVTVQGDHIIFRAGSVQANALVISQVFGGYFYSIVFDDVYPITLPTSACYVPNPADQTRVACITVATLLDVQTYDLNDSVVNLTPFGGVIGTGEGNDAINTFASTAPLTVDGGAGADTIRPGRASDTIEGGTGNDKVSYVDRTSPMYLRLVESATGTAYPMPSRVGGERDTLLSVEGGVGGSGADTIDVNNASFADGGPGNDSISCTGNPVNFSVVIYGGDGDDVVTSDLFCHSTLWMYGGGGNDILDSDNADGESYLNGGAGNDALLGSDYDDWLAGGAGFDFFNGRAGDDACFVEPGESVASCETVGSG